MSKKDRKDKHHRKNGDNGNVSAMPRADLSDQKIAISVEDYQAQLHLLQVELAQVKKSCANFS